MTDPRILDCAKAIYALHRVPKPEFVVWDALGDLARSHWIKLARTCILKWLEQKPSDTILSGPGTMTTSGADVLRERFGEIGMYERRNAAENIYAAMCAQAARELK